MGAPLQPVPGVLKVVLQGFVDTSSADSIWENVLHFQYGGTPPSNATCTQIGTNIGAAWAAQVASLCPSPTTLQIVAVTDLTSNSAGEGEAAVLHPGTRGDDSVASSTAVLISYPASFRYKGGHPRTYVYCLGNADLQGATNWSTAATAEVQSHWISFLFGCLSAGSAGTTLSSPCAVSYKSKFAPNSGPPHFYRTTPLVIPFLYSSAKARQRIASQRRRLTP